MATGSLNPEPTNALGRGPSKRAADARCARLFEKLEPVAKGMVRKAFPTAFSEDELDDLYSSAWLSTLGALERRPRRLDDDDLRRYVMTAVANQAGREMRRRGRKPTVALEAVYERAADEGSPEEIAARSEQARLTREVLGSMSPRRRAVLLYRYGWDLEPSEVCGMVDGLSPRAYRKEIERGVAEIAKKMRLVNEGEWCATREPLLRAVVAGEADAEQERQAQRHLANCRSCASFVSKLSGHLHELGGVAVIGAFADDPALDPASLADRAAALIDRAKAAAGSVFSRGTETAEAATAQVMTSGGTRGAGVAGAGALAKLAGLGAVPKLVAACVGGSAAATACIAAGVVPDLAPDRDRTRATAQQERIVEAAPRETARHTALPSVLDEPQPPAPGPEPPPQSGSAPNTPAPAPAPAPTPGPSDPAPQPVEPAPPPEVQEFEPVGVPVGPAPSAATSSGGGGGPPPSGGGDFGP